MTDWLYAEVGNLTLPDPQLCERVKTEALHITTTAFQANASRIYAFWRLHPHLVEMASVNIVQLVETIYSFTKKPFLTKEQNEDPAFRQKVADEVKRRLTKRFEESGSLEYATGYSFEHGVERFGALLSTVPDMEDAIYATFSAQLTSTWTALEALASDLWEAAVNEHPEILSRLAGRKKRIAKLAAGKAAKTAITTDAKAAEPALADIERVTCGGFYDTSEVMGTLLRENLRFQTLRGIRAAYSAAFSSCYEQIDNILVDRALDKLALTRNLLVHKAGIVDEVFLKGAESLSWPVFAQSILG